MIQKILFIFCLLCITLSCGEDDNQNQGYSPTPVNIAVPAVFSQLLPAPEIPANNPLTQEGIALASQAEIASCDTRGHFVL